MNASIRQVLRSVLPRKLWEEARAMRNLKRIKQVEHVCLGQMVAASANVEPRIKGCRSIISGNPLRRILLIADVMWETNEPVPELRRICDVRVHDLRPDLRSAGLHGGPETVFRSVERFLPTLQGGEPDVIFLYLRGNLLSNGLFDLLRKRFSCPLLGMNLDDKVSFWDYGAAGGGDHCQHWAPKFDLNITNSKIAVEWYRQADAECLHIAPAMKRPDGLGEPNGVDFRHLLGFVGSPKLDRAELVGSLRGAGLPVAVFGKGWPEGGWVEDPVQVYRSCQINLGLGMATPRLATVKNRDFECPGSGACYLTTFNWELAEFWEIGKEILCYRNTEELIEIVCWYRNRPEACAAIAKAAWRRGMAEHTWELRFRKLFREMGFEV